MLNLFVFRLQHAWAVLRRDEPRAQALLEILIMLDTTALKANAAAAVSALASTKAELATTKAALADATAKLDAVDATEKAAQDDVNAVSDQLAAAVAPTDQPSA